MLTARGSGAFRPLEKAALITICGIVVMVGVGARVVAIVAATASGCG
jgi:hypothetical protein